MGQAFDRDGNVLGEAYGQTKREVFDKLDKAFKDAHEIRIQSLKPSAEMPRYKCHKEVRALKILSVTTEPQDGSCLLTFEDTRFSPLRLRGDYVDKHQPRAGGYFVVYEDGYLSWSPALAFEEGYTLIPE